MGSDPSILFFWGAQPIKLTDRDSMIAKMHSCERSDHFVKPARDLESLGHYGVYETETAGVRAVKNKYETQWQIKMKWS